MAQRKSGAGRKHSTVGPTKHHRRVSSSADLIAAANTAFEWFDLLFLSLQVVFVSTSPSEAFNPVLQRNFAIAHPECGFSRIDPNSPIWRDPSCVNFIQSAARELGMPLRRGRPPSGYYLVRNLQVLAYHDGRFVWAQDQTTLGVSATVGVTLWALLCNARALKEGTEFGVSSGPARRVQAHFDEVLRSIGTAERQRAVPPPSAQRPSPKVNRLDDAVARAFKDLGLDAAVATRDDVHVAYRKLIRQHHPDRCRPEDLQRATTYASLLNQAKATLNEHFDRRAAQ